MYESKVRRFKIRKGLGRIRELQVGRNKCNFLNNDAIILAGAEVRAEN